MKSARFGSYTSPEDRTQVVINLYDKNLDNIHIFGEFYKLDFRNLRISNSSFNNYDRFFDSKFNDRTKFIDTKFTGMKGGGVAFLVDTSLTPDNFDTTCTFSDEFDYALKNSFQDKNTLLKLILADLMKFFKVFFVKNIRFASVPRFQLKIDLSSGIPYTLYLKVFEDIGMLERDSKNEYRIRSEYKDSVSKFTTNNNPDININRIVNRIYTEYKHK